jgi:aryl-alcohol dehydrogenase-like predicted oxidoreductase
MQNKPQPILGTAMWGWTIPKATCFQQLDFFYQKGFRQVDTATNYPINKNPNDFRLAEKILQEWIVTHGITDLEVIVKVGSLNNLGGPEHNLTKSFLLLVLDEYDFLFHQNLHTFSIHWDNRDDPELITDTFEAFKIAAESGLKPGLSGIRHPDIYARINESYAIDFRIQMKHNILYSDFERYAPLHQMGNFLSYGINAGGIKLDQKSFDNNSSLKVRGGSLESSKKVTPALLKIISKANENRTRVPIRNMNQCGLCFAWYQDKVKGILLGTSRSDQLKASLEFMDHLSNFDYQDLYNDLSTLNQTLNQ